MLDVLQCRYAITVRHPLDYVVAAYCHNNVKRAFRDPHANMGVGPLDERRFELGHDVDQVLTHLIQDGHLFDALTWMARWLYHRDQDKSVVVRYEDVVDEEKQDSEFQRISMNVFGCHLDDNAIEKCRNVFASQKSKRGVTR